MTSKSSPVIFVAILTTAVLLTSCGSSAGPKSSLQPTRLKAPIVALPSTTSAPTTTVGTPALPTTTSPPSTTSPSTPSAPATTTTTSCSSNPAGELASSGQAAQLIMVSASSYSTTYATLTAWQ